MAEHCGHGKHDELVSPRQVLSAEAEERTEVRGHEAGRVEREGSGREVERGKEIGVAGRDVNVSCTIAPQSAGALVAGTLHQTREIDGTNAGQREGNEDPPDRHPDEGLVPGSSKDGLSPEEATEEDAEEGR